MQLLNVLDIVRLAVEISRLVQPADLVMHCTTQSASRRVQKAYITIHQASANCAIRNALPAKAVRATVRKVANFHMCLKKINAYLRVPKDM